MNDLFLAMIAVGVLVMATIQVGALMYAVRVGRRVDRLASQLEQDIRPVFEDLRAVTADAARTMTLVVEQAERADRLFGDIATRIEQTFTLVQEKILVPVREGAALLAGVRAALAMFRNLRDVGKRSAPGVEEEDALFIG